MITNTQQKAPGACDSKGLITDTNKTDFRSQGPIQQAHDGKAIATTQDLALAGRRMNRSSAVEAQYARSLEMLRSGEKSTIELRRGGVMMPAARVKELVEKRGYDISRVALRDMYDEWGFLHPRVAVYALLAEPGVTQ